MKVISSQMFRDWEKVAQYEEELLENVNQEITLPVIETGLKNEDGEDLYILIDGHHRLQAVKELSYEDIDINVNFEVVENESGLTGEDALKEWHIDSDWYYVDTEEFVW